MKELYNKVLDAVALDPRLDTGIFDVSNNDHLAIFREHLIKEGGTSEMAVAASNRLAEVGRFPERQAYNKDGLLVTFPSPEHKQRALARGTHFEKNPKTAQTNIFGGETQPAQPAPATQTAPATQPAKITQPATTAAAPTAAQPTAITPATAVTPTSTSSEAPTPLNPDNRTPEERAVDAQSIEKMLKTEKTSYTLSEAISFGFYSKNNVWYSSDGEKVGRLWYVVDRKQQLILPC